MGCKARARSWRDELDESRAWCDALLGRTLGYCILCSIKVLVLVNARVEDLGFEDSNSRMDM